MLYCLSQRQILHNAKTITTVVVVGTHLTFLALLPSLSRTPFRVSTINPPIHVYTYFYFHPHFHQRRTFSACLCQTASPQTPAIFFYFFKSSVCIFFPFIYIYIYSNTDTINFIIFLQLLRCQFLIS